MAQREADHGLELGEVDLVRLRDRLAPEFRGECVVGQTAPPHLILDPRPAGGVHVEARSFTGLSLVQTEERRPRTQNKMLYSRHFTLTTRVDLLYAAKSIQVYD